MRVWESLPMPNFVKIAEWYTPLEQIYTKKYQFWHLKAHIFKATTMKFGTRLRSWNAPNLVKIAQGDLPLVTNFYQKFEVFTILCCLSPHFYTYNVDFVLLKPTFLYL